MTHLEPFVEAILNIQVDLTQHAKERGDKKAASVNEVIWASNDIRPDALAHAEYRMQVKRRMFDRLIEEVGTNPTVRALASSLKELDLTEEAPELDLGRKLSRPVAGIREQVASEVQMIVFNDVAVQAIGTLGREFNDACATAFSEGKRRKKKAPDYEVDLAVWIAGAVLDRKPR